MSDYGQLQQVIVEPKGSTLSNDAASGDTFLTVDDAQDFDPDGGTLDLNGARLQYTSVVEGTNPDDPDVVNLADPLAADGSEDDAVSPVVGGAIPEDWYAVITMGDDGEEAHIPLTLDQRAQWAVGDYADPVPVTVSDDLQTLLDAPGRTVTPSTLAPDFPRLTVFSEIDPGDWAGLGITNGSSGHFAIPAWNVPEEEIGAATFDHTAAATIGLVEPGIYAVNIALYVDGTEAADPSMSLRFQAYPSGQTPNFDCGVRGGDTEGSDSIYNPTPGSSSTYFYGPGDHVGFEFAYSNFDTDHVGTIGLAVSVQQLFAGSARTTTPPPDPPPVPDIVIAESFENGDLGDFLRESNCPGLTFVYSDGNGIFVADPHSGAQAALLSDGLGDHGMGLTASTVRLESPDGATELGFYFKMAQPDPFFDGVEYNMLNIGWQPPGGLVGSEEKVQVDFLYADPGSLHVTDSLGGYDETTTLAYDTWYVFHIDSEGYWYISTETDTLIFGNLDPIPSAGRVFYATAVGNKYLTVDDFYYRPAPDVE